MRNVEAAEPGSIRLRVIGHQWWWEFEYPDLGVVTANELYVPVGRSVVDRARVGRRHPQLLRAALRLDARRGARHDQPHAGAASSVPGTFDGACTAVLRAAARLDATAGDRRAARAVRRLGAAAAPAGRLGLEPARSAGLPRKHVRQLPRHSWPAGATAQVGPDLTHVGQSHDARRWGDRQHAREPARVAARRAERSSPGVLMPAFLGMSEEDLSALAEYLELLAMTTLLEPVPAPHAMPDAAGWPAALGHDGRPQGHRHPVPAHERRRSSCSAASKRC